MCVDAAVTDMFGSVVVTSIHEIGDHCSVLGSDFNVDSRLLQEVPEFDHFTSNNF
jgi:hypothetical protein